MARARAKPRRKKPDAKRGARNASRASAKTAGMKAKSTAPMEDAEPSLRARIVLPETLDSSSAANIKDQLLHHRGSAVEVDAGQVRRTGIQAIQVLIAAAQTWKSDAREYVVANPSSEFIDTLVLSGLSREQLFIEGISG